MAAVQISANGIKIMRKPDLNDPDLPLSEVFRIWPETRAVFLERQMLCVGCAIAPFHTIADACVEYDLDEQEFRAELNGAVKSASHPHF